MDRFQTNATCRLLQAQWSLVPVANANYVCNSWPFVGARTIMWQWSKMCNIARFVSSLIAGLGVLTWVAYRALIGTSRKWIGGTLPLGHEATRSRPPARLSQGCYSGEWPRN